MKPLPHKLLSVLLALGLVAALAIGLTGQFKFFDDKGILSGPFSALLLTSAVLAALLASVMLDWRVWQPARQARKDAFERWLARGVLGIEAAPAQHWTSLAGRFRGRAAAVERSAPGGGVRWSMSAATPLSLRVVRLSVAQSSGLRHTPEDCATARFESGDPEFETRYTWQTDRPQDVAPHLRDPLVRAAVKRLASLIARRGGISDPHAGIEVSAGRISLQQHPAPEFSGGESARREALMILHDLSVLAAALENAAPPAPRATPVGGADASAPGWLALGCAGAASVALWLGATWLLARLAGLAAAMIAFFVPALLLVFSFMAASAAGSGRDPEVEDAIRAESARLAASFEDLAALEA